MCAHKIYIKYISMRGYRARYIETTSLSVICLSVSVSSPRVALVCSVVITKIGPLLGGHSMLHSLYSTVIVHYCYRPLLLFSRPFFDN